MPLGISFPRAAWVTLNRLQTGVGLFRSKTHKWSIAFTAACKCGAKDQTTEHAIASCPLYHHPNRPRGLSHIKQESGDLIECLAI